MADEPKKPVRRPAAANKPAAKSAAANAAKKTAAPKPASAEPPVVTKSNEIKEKSNMEALGMVETLSLIHISRVKTLVIPTNEEYMIAMDTARLATK